MATPDDVIHINNEGIELVQAATLTVNPCTAYRMLKDFVTLKEGYFLLHFDYFYLCSLKLRNKTKIF